MMSALPIRYDVINDTIHKIPPTSEAIHLPCTKNTDVLRVQSGRANFTHDKIPLPTYINDHIASVVCGVDCVVLHRPVEYPGGTGRMTAPSEGTGLNELASAMVHLPSRQL